MNSTPDSNHLPPAHRPMNGKGKFFQSVPEPSSLEPVAPSYAEPMHATIRPPELISTPYQLISYMLAMVKIRDHELYPTDMDSVVKQVWEANVHALDQFIREGLGLVPDTEESRIVVSLFILLERRKVQDQFPKDSFWNNDYQFHWEELSSIARYYIKKNQPE